MPRSGGCLVVDALLMHGTDTVFCVPGESYLPVLDALYDASGQIRLVSCRHESGAAFMAAAQAALTGRPGVCFVTRGPGATNASIALHVARQASVPLVLGVGQVARRNLGRDAFQEVDFEAFFAPLVKHVEQVNGADAIPDAIARAFHEALRGRPGPVVLAFPEDVLSEQVRAAAVTPRPPVRCGPTDAETAAIEGLLNAAKRPLVLLGGGTFDDAAIAHIEAFARLNALPVCTSFRRLDHFDNRHPSYAGYLGLSAHVELWTLAEASDCVLVLGARLDEPTTRGYALFREKGARKLVHVYPNRAELGRNYDVDLGVCADVRAAAAALASIELEDSADREGWCRRLREAYVAASTPPANDARLDPGRIMARLNRRLPDDAIVTIDAGNFTRWPQRYRAYRRPGRLLGPVNGAMGYGVPAAIGASLAFPDRRVAAFVGDGGMLMTGMELATAAKYGATPLVLVLNNGKYGTIETHQDRRYPGRRIGNDLVNPDFAAFARSFGLFGARVETNDGIDDALDRAMAAVTAAVIEFVLDRD
jgi:acetolactate synthase I/II/III large subunit